MLFGCLVIASINLSAGSRSGAGNVILQGFPPPVADEVGSVAAQDNSGRRVCLRTNGNLEWDGAGVSSYVDGRLVYYTNPS